MTFVKPSQAKTARGALVVTPPGGSTRRIEFQYNPESLTVNLSGRLYAAKDGKKPYSGAPSQTIDVTVQLEATRLEPSERGQAGIRPQLALLEMLLYPKLDDVKKNKSLLGEGKIAAVPVDPPTVLFVYGNRPAMPVRLTGVTVEEQIHDGKLNPIAAKVTLKMEAITYSDVPTDDPNFEQFVTYHQRLAKAAES